MIQMIYAWSVLLAMQEINVNYVILAIKTLIALLAL